uniref:HORMA domain-containing protein n=1 Tax=Opuntia streptacantha TaxID=393608 RepID=A0A7C8YV24_OPUST
MASRTITKDIITLRGSAAIVSEFFGYAANSILYNRGVYAEESFAKVKKYGLPMLLTQDEGVKTFIANLTAQLSGSLFFFFQSILWVSNLSIDFGEFDAIF